MSESKINISEIFKKHLETLKDDGKIPSLDFKIFILLPIFIGFIAVILSGTINDNSSNIFSICLSILIGMFLNLLVLLVSFSENKLKIKDNTNRKELLKQTFYNINYTIVASIIGLGILYLSVLEFNSDLKNVIKSFEIEFIKKHLIDIRTVLKALKFTVSFIFYAFFTHIVFTLLMIIKRIYSFFNVEIDN